MYSYYDYNVQNTDALVEQNIIGRFSLTYLLG